MIKTLVIEPNPQQALDLFKNVFFQQAVTVVENLADALHQLEFKHFDVVFLSQAPSDEKEIQVQQIVDRAKLLSSCTTASAAIDLLEEVGLNGVVLYPHQKLALRKLLSPLQGLNNLDGDESDLEKVEAQEATEQQDTTTPSAPAHLPLATRAIEVTLRAIDEASSSGKYLLTNLPEIFSLISERINYENQLISSLACRLLPIGFTVLAPEEIDRIRGLQPENPYFQLAVRRAFLSAARMTEKLQLLRPISECFRLSPFATGQLTHNREKDLASILHASTIWTLGQAIGLNASECKRILDKAFPAMHRRLRSAFHSMPRFRIRETIIPLSELNSGMVIKEDLRFKAGALLLPADSWIDDQTYQEISGEARTNSTKSILVAMDSLNESDQLKYKEVFYINKDKPEPRHSRCEIVSQFKTQPNQQTG